jgi:hypothetical protein
VTAASAATGVTAAGSATSIATLASLEVGSVQALTQTIAGHAISIGTLSTNAQNLTATQAPTVTFAPLTVDNVATGAVTVTPANSPLTVGGVSTGALPLNVLSATSPSATLSAASSSLAKTAGVTSKLGSAKILGLPVTLNGGLTVGSTADGAHAQAGKTLSLTNVSLPNIADLLGALGIDITKLPVGTLNGLVEELPLAISEATGTAIEAANTAIDSAATTEAQKQAAYDSAAAQVAATAAALDAQLAAVPALPAGSAPLDHTEWDQITALGATGTTFQAAVVTLYPAVGTTATAYTTAKSALDAANLALNTATLALQDAIAALADLVAGVLAGTPLVSVGAAQIGTSATVGSSKTAAVTGYVSGVKVMGEDVLATLTGNSKLDAAKLVGDVADQVNSELADLSATLSGVLSTVTGAAGLVVPAPRIQLMVKKTLTGTSGAFGTADATVTALSVTLGSVTVPQNFALATAGSLAGIGDTATGFKTAPLSIKVGVLGEAARFRPAGSTTTPGSNGQMPSTGAPYGLAVVAVIGTALAVGVRRRLRTTD